MCCIGIFGLKQEKFRSFAKKIRDSNPYIYSHSVGAVFFTILVVFRHSNSVGNALIEVIHMMVHNKEKTGETNIF
jgi:hypothetical protein